MNFQVKNQSSLLLNVGRPKLKTRNFCLRHRCTKISSSLCSESIIAVMSNFYYALEILLQKLLSGMV